MSFCFRIIEPQCISEQFQRDVIGLLKFPNRLPELFSPSGHERLKVSLVGSVLQLEAAILQCSAHGRNELLAVEGFQQIVVSAIAQGSKTKGNIPHASLQDKSDVGILGLDALQQVHAIHPRHHQIGQYEFKLFTRSEPFEQGKSFTPIPGFPAIVVSRSERRNNKLTCGFIVFHYKNALWHWGDSPRLSNWLLSMASQSGMSNR